MKSIITPSFRRLLPSPALVRSSALLLGLLCSPAEAKQDRVEIPLILESERQLERLLLSKYPAKSRTGPSENHTYDNIVCFGLLEKLEALKNDSVYIPKDYEPVGLLIDSDPNNALPVRAGGIDSQSRMMGKGTGSGSSGFELKKNSETVLAHGASASTKYQDQPRSSSAFYFDWEFSVSITHERNGNRFKTSASGKGKLVPLHWLAESLAFYSKKNVLVSARVEKRWCPEFRLNDGPGENLQTTEELLEAEGVQTTLIGPDAYVLLEAPGKEQPFLSYGRARAAQLELEREAWLVENEDYVAQGLIYQPTPGVPIAYPKRNVCVRHAAAALAKLTGKEVFVQPRVEKREFNIPHGATQQATTEQELDLLTRQLNISDVRIMELNPQSLALVSE